MCCTCWYRSRHVARAHNSDGHGETDVASPFQALSPFLVEAVRNRHFDLDKLLRFKPPEDRNTEFLGAAICCWRTDLVPDRQTLARLCARFCVKLHDTEGNYNVRSAKDFKRELWRIIRWYKQRRRTTILRQRKVLRKKIIRGKAGVLSKKVAAG